MSSIEWSPAPRPTPAEIVRQAIAAFTGRDAGALFERVAPEIGVFASDLNSWGGVYDGIAEVHRQLLALLAGRELEVRVERIEEVGQRIATAGAVRGFVRELGVPFELPFVCLWTVRRDAILGLEIYTGPAAASALALHEEEERPAGTRTPRRG